MAFGETPLEGLPLDRQADEAPGRAAGTLGRERPAAVEGAFLRAHRPGEVELVRRGLLILDQCSVGRMVIDVEHHQSRLDAGEVQGPHPRGRDPMRGAGLDQCVPQGGGLGCLDPDLVAEVPRVAGARDRDGDVAHRGLYEPKVLERGEVGGRDLREHGARERPLDRKRPDPLRDVLDQDLHSDRVHRQPAQGRIGAGKAERAFVESADGPVVDHLARDVAPRRIEHLADAKLRDVTRHHAIEQARGVTPGDPVLVERRDVDERGRVTDRGVLAVRMRIVRARHLVTGPAAPGLGAHQRRGAGVEGRRLQHRGTVDRAAPTPAPYRFPAVFHEGPGRPSGAGTPSTRLISHAESTVMNTSAPSTGGAWRFVAGKQWNEPRPMGGAPGQGDCENHGRMRFLAE